MAGFLRLLEIAWVWKDESVSYVWSERTMNFKITSEHLWEVSDAFSIRRLKDKTGSHNLETSED